MEYIGAVFGDRILRAVISNPRLKSAECKKVEIRLTDIGGREVLVLVYKCGQEKSNNLYY